MKAAARLVLTMVVSASLASAILAKGSGGGHGSSHGGGHTGGHSASSHGSASSGHVTHGGGARHGGSATSSSNATSASATATAPSGRPRGSLPVVGTAVPRPPGIPVGGIVPPVVSVPSYYVWPYGSAFGASFYSPFWGVGYPGYVSGYAPDSIDTSGATGGLRLKITPKEAEVFVDGDYAGIVDDFDGLFQHLNLTPGPHHIDVRAPGYDVFGLDVSIQPYHTTEYRGQLQPAAR